MVGGSTSPILQPLRTIAGAGGGGGSDNLSAGGTTTTASADADNKHPRRTTTTAAGATTSTNASRTTTTAAGNTTSTPVGGTVPPSPIGNCKAGDLAYSTNTAKPSYRPNGPVDISITVRNATNRPCYAPAPCGITAWASVEDTSGATVWKNSPASTPCPNPPPSSPLLNPNDTHNYGTVAVWNQIVCPDGDGCSGAHAPAGTYRAVARRGSATAAGVTFALRG
ncbi:MAG TPA: hypothetical protein VFB78_09825 [Acidimicrobiales bacterium]|nr:hypothetical protein [Acidimicrobiales bacterium]